MIKETLKSKGYGKRIVDDALINTYINRELKKRKGIDWLTTKQWKDIFIKGSAYGAACCTQAGTTTSVRPEHAEGLIKEQGAKISRGTKIMKYRK